MTLLVLRCADLERAVLFYRALGLNLVPEKHGRGVQHYAASLEGAVLELYPLRERPTRGLRLGLRVESLRDALAKLATLGARPTNPAEEVTAGRAIVEDFDGHSIELT